jgi:hypothetical protein
MRLSEIDDIVGARDYNWYITAEVLLPKDDKIAENLYTSFDLDGNSM